MKTDILNKLHTSTPLENNGRTELGNAKLQHLLSRYVQGSHSIRCIPTSIWVTKCRSLFTSGEKFGQKTVIKCPPNCSQRGKIINPKINLRNETNRNANPNVKKGAIRLDFPREAKTHHYTAFWCFHLLVSIILVEDTLNKWSKIHPNCPKHYARNTSVDHARRTSMWYDGMFVTTTASDLPHEIETKCLPVNRNLDIKWHERQ